MTFFTTELRELNRQYPNWIQKYPIYDESHREELNRNILDHFYFREIGVETCEMFIHRFNTKMRLIMPRHNMMYRQMTSEFNPLANYIMQTTGQDANRSTLKRISKAMETGRVDVESAMRTIRDQNNKSTDTKNQVSDSSSVSDSTSKARSGNSEFPQVALSETGDYATSGSTSISDGSSSSKAKDSVTNSSNSTMLGHGEDNETGTTGTTSSNSSNVDDATTGTNDSDMSRFMSGRTTDVATLLARWLEVGRTVDEMILEDLEPLFMQIHSTNDTFTPYPGYYGTLFPGFVGRF